MTLNLRKGLRADIAARGVRSCLGGLGLLMLSATVFADTQTQTDTLSSMLDVITLLDTGEAEKAYNILIKQEEHMAGWWEYDYLLGLVLLDKGDANLAIFALQRCVAMNPNMLGARVDLGRAYYQVQEYHEALTEFEKVLASGPNEKLKQTVNSYVDRIKSRERGRAFASTSSIAFTSGFDSNANSATEEKEFLGFTLPEENQRTPTAYVQGKAGIQVGYTLSSATQWVLAANAGRRQNFDAPQVNYSDYAVRTGLGFGGNKLHQQVSINLARTEVANNLTNHIGALLANIEYRVTPQLGMKGNINVSRLSYNGALSERNADQLTASGGFGFYPRQHYLPELVMTGVIGNSKTIDPDSFYGKTLLGGRVSVLKKFHYGLAYAVDWSSSAILLNYPKSIIQGESRQDGLVDTAINISATTRSKWTVVMRIAYTRNKSTIDLYEYMRIHTAASLIKSF